MNRSEELVINIAWMYVMIETHEPFALIFAQLTTGYRGVMLITVEYLNNSVFGNYCTVSTGYLIIHAGQSITKISGFDTEHIPSLLNRI